MQVRSAYRYRFYPTAAQEDVLRRLLGSIRFVYNQMRERRERCWSEEKRTIRYAETSSMLTAMKRTAEFEWLNDVAHTPMQQALRQLDRAYGNFFNGRARYPKFRSKRNRQSAEFTRSAFTFRNNKIVLSRIPGALRIVWSRDLPGHPTSVTVCLEPTGEWYISCWVAEEKPALQGGGAVGVDLGVAQFAALSSGEVVTSPRNVSKRQKMLARVQRALSRKQKGSKNRARARLKVSRCYAAAKSARHDFLHKLSTRLIRENQTICIEDLSITGLLRSKRMSRSISDASWGEFARMLEYKASWYGRTLVRVDRFFPSTKTCSECGSTGHKLELSDRQWICPDCGAHHDRDVNAARNILTAGLAVTACGEGVSLGMTSHLERPPVKQEPVLS